MFQKTKTDKGTKSGRRHRPSVKSKIEQLALRYLEEEAESEPDLRHAIICKQFGLDLEIFDPIARDNHRIQQVIAQKCIQRLQDDQELQEWAVDKKLEEIFGVARSSHHERGPKRAVSVINKMIQTIDQYDALRDRLEATDKPGAVELIAGLLKDPNSRMIMDQLITLLKHAAGSNLHRGDMTSLAPPKITGLTELFTGVPFKLAVNPSGSPSKMWEKRIDQTGSDNA